MSKGALDSQIGFIFDDPPKNGSPTASVRDGFEMHSQGLQGQLSHQ